MFSLEDVYTKGLLTPLASQGIQTRAPVVLPGPDSNLVGASYWE